MKKRRCVCIEDKFWKKLQELAKKELGWVAVHDLEQMCEDSWRWQSQNPEGYEKN